MSFIASLEDRPGPILPPRRGTGLLHIQILFLSFIAAIALGVFISSERNTAAGGNLVIQIMPDGETPSPAEVDAALSLLKDTPGITSATVLSREENLALLQPWLSPDSAPETLPFPALIEVRVAAGAKPDVSALKTRLAAGAPHSVIIGDGSANRNRFGLDRSAAIAALGLTASCLVFFLSFASTTRAQVWVQRDALDLLQILGATNRRVGSIFAQRPSIAAFVAALCGTGLGAAVMAVAAAPQRIGLKVTPVVPMIEPLDLVPLAVIPVAMALIAWMTARFLVHSALRN
jgi:cell division transport system permease protein